MRVYLQIGQQLFSVDLSAPGGAIQILIRDVRGRVFSNGARVKIRGVGREMIIHGVGREMRQKSAQMN